MRRRRAFLSRRKQTSGSERELNNITCRTVYIDNFLTFFTSRTASKALLPHMLALRANVAERLSLSWKGHFQQAVLVGAGMDTRAWRLNLPSDLTLFELDRELVLRVKSTLLKQGSIDGPLEKCRRVGISYDPSHMGP
jgi:O-methyltransferase involved in polyketide biosynthesis